MLATAAAIPTAYASDARATAAITGETGAGHSGAVRAAVVLGRDLHVVVALTAVDIAILDLAVWEMHVPVEVRQIVLVCPLGDLPLVSVRTAVGIWPVAIPLLQPLLALALQLVIEPHALNLQAALFQARCLALVGSINLSVVFQFTLAFEARPESLAGIPVAVSIRFQKVPTTVSQDDGLFAVTRDANGLDKTLFAEVAEVAATRIARPVITIAKVAGGHDPKRTDRHEGAAL
jgi:hypothetical protein